MADFALGTHSTDPAVDTDRPARKPGRETNTGDYS
jgi:CPA2 family monovalent cation:H+ antiporter-2